VQKLTAIMFSSFFVAFLLYSKR